MTSSEFVICILGGQLVGVHKQPRGLPTDLRCLLESGEVLICGSAIGLDIHRLATAPINRLVDTRKVFDHGVRYGHWTNVCRSGRKSGLGIQAVTVFETLNAYLKVDPKDKRVSQFKPPFPKGFLDDTWRHPVQLYNWGGINQCLHDRQRLYLFVDALTPIFLILKLIASCIEKQDVEGILGMTSVRDMFLTKFSNLLFSPVLDFKQDPDADSYLAHSSLGILDPALAGPNIGPGIAGPAQAGQGQVTGNGTSESLAPDLGNQDPKLLAFQEKVLKTSLYYLKFCIYCGVNFRSSNGTIGCDFRTLSKFPTPTPGRQTSTSSCMEKG